ncbi:MAG: dienelactone hydrolase family protein [Alphaproteobacteria bacterium]|nr:dienelactone hydrolase family protein [Alphaproteobacteria bacterium]
MSEMIKLTASDGFTFGAYHVPAKGTRKGGLIVVQEIFGVNDDIRRTSEDFAALGYEVLAPSMYDRVKPGLKIDSHSQEALAEAMPVAQANGLENPVKDLQACVNFLKPKGPVYVTGFCYGGSASWIAATQVEGVNAASCYYGSLLPNLAHQQPKCAVIAHFGATDPFIPMENVERFKAEQPKVPVYLYDAGHGFFTKGGMAYDEAAMKASLKRTLDLFEANA